MGSRVCEENTNGESREEAAFDQEIQPQDYEFVLPIYRREGREEDREEDREGGCSPTNQ